MSFHWGTALTQLIFIALVLLFFFSIYRFARRIMLNTQTNREILETLVRIENKLDLNNTKDELLNQLALTLNKNEVIK